MHFADSDAQRLLRETARSYLKERYPWERLFALEQGEAPLDRGDVGEYAQLGWLGLLVPEQEGGAGASLLEAGVVVEELGYAAVAAPVPHALVVSYVLQRAPRRDDSLRQHLRRLASGHGLYGLALPSEGWAMDGGRPSASVALEGGRLEGELPLVPFAHVLDFVLAPLVADGVPALGLLPLAEAQKDGQPLLDLRPAGRVHFLSTPLGEGDIIARGEEAAQLQEECQALLTAFINLELAGLMQRVVAMTSEYIANRIQFGRPIATFQAARHRAAEMFMMAETLRWAAYHSLWRFQEDPADTVGIWQARYWAAQAAQVVYTNGHMLHGGVGVGLEYPLHLFTHPLMGLPVLGVSQEEVAQRISRAVLPGA
jgi:alkylation response protein AidB-like acyl-CoA dehydrogenase